MMKKKLLIYMLGVLVISLVIVTMLFTFIVKYKYEENMKDRLQSSNLLVINLIEKDNIKDINLFFKENFKEAGIRVTYIDDNGDVLYDSIFDAETMENHSSRKEVKDAYSYGKGYAIRYSYSEGINVMYYATRFTGNNVIRSAIAMDSIRAFEGQYLRYYIIIIIFVVNIATLVSLSLANKIVKPLQELEAITFQIANGKLEKRANIKSRDETGKLASTFNHMAEELESTIKDSVDKKNKLQAILTSMESGVVAIDKKYKIILINPYAENIFGIHKNIIGENLMDNIRDFEIENVFKYDLKEKDYSEMQILHPEKRELRIKTANIVNGNNIIGKVAVIQDITNIKKLENVRSQFVANVSHELKTPLTSIIGFSETLKDVEDEETKNKFLNIINEEANRLTRLINDILVLSDIENNKNKTIEKVDLNESIEDVFELMKSSAKIKNIEMIINGDKLPWIYGNKDEIKQMLINLVDNAIKYNNTHGCVLIQKKKTDNYCEIFIKDTGCGIPKEHIERLFERFYRVDKARSRAEGGTGLGLAIVKHIVLSLKGTIDVESEIGKGSTFVIKIPISHLQKNS